MIGGALEERQPRRRARDDPRVWCPPAVEPTDEPWQDEHAIQRLGEGEGIAHLRELMMDQVEVVIN